MSNEAPDTLARISRLESQIQNMKSQIEGIENAIKTMKATKKRPGID